jgi:hypothetical protein
MSISPLRLQQGNALTSFNLSKVQSLTYDCILNLNANCLGPISFPLLSQTDMGIQILVSLF